MPTSRQSEVDTHNCRNLSLQAHGCASVFRPDLAFHREIPALSGFAPAVRSTRGDQVRGCLTTPTPGCDADALRTCRVPLVVWTQTHAPVPPPKIILAPASSWRRRPGGRGSPGGERLQHNPWQRVVKQAQKPTLTSPVGISAKEAQVYRGGGLHTRISACPAKSRCQRVTTTVWFLICWTGSVPHPLTQALKKHLPERSELALQEWMFHQLLEPPGKTCCRLVQGLSQRTERKILCLAGKKPDLFCSVGNSMAGRQC